MILVSGLISLRAAEPAKPLKVFILAGQSNMEGQSVADLEGKDYNNGKGTLNALLKSRSKAMLVQNLKSPNGQWALRDDVWVRYQPENQPAKIGPLTLGYTPYDGAHHFGPELQFGYLMGDYFTNQVLLIKTAWGGKSLYKDFRPPSSGGQVGPYYTKMIADVKTALDRLKTDFPAYNNKGYELSGFVWYQGWNDGVDPKRAVPEYEQNLVNLIHDVRKDLKTPKLPVVVGELTGPWVDAPEAWAKLRQAQHNAANRDEFKGNVAFTETRNFVRRAEESPNPGHGHHEFGNAETGILVGDALGASMIRLLANQPETVSGDPLKPSEYKSCMIEGWKVEVDQRLFESADEELGKRALRFLENKLADIKVVVPAGIVKKLQTVEIVMDKSHGKLTSMQYHPSQEWLKANGYSEKLARCVHLPRAQDLATKRNINQQPWVILHELAHAYHDQILGFEDPQIMKAFTNFKASGRGQKTLLFNGKRVDHYALTNQMEFFAEMTESYFGMNDFFPFNRAELIHSEPEIYELMTKIWGAVK
jgi:hypothetical protein